MWTVPAYNSFVSRALHCGGLWLQALSLLHTRVLKQTDLHDLYLDVSSNDGSDSTGTIHISEVLHQLYVIPYFYFIIPDIRVSKWSNMGWTGHVAHIWEMRSTSRILSKKKSRAETFGGLGINRIMVLKWILKKYKCWRQYWKHHR